MKLGITSKKMNIDINEYIDDFKTIKEAGFDSIDFESFMNRNNLYNLNDNDFEEFLTNVKNVAVENDLIINQLHSFWEFTPTLDYKKETLEDEIKYYKRAIEGAKYLGCKYVVIHQRFPFGLDQEINDLKEEEFYHINVDFLTKLEKYARENKVILCLENLPMNFKYCKVDGTLKIIDAVNSSFVKMCFDIGHANVHKDNLYDDIIKIGNKLMCLHVHDNMYGYDLHLYPYQGTVNWDDVIRGLKEINYQGVFSFETAPSNSLNKEARLSGLKHIYEIGKYLWNK